MTKDAGATEMDAFSYHTLIRRLKKLLAQPLPGGRGFQHERDKEIQHCCKLIAEAELPDRSYHGR